MEKRRHSLRSQADAVADAVRRAIADGATPDAFVLDAARDTLLWLDRHATALRALARDAQRLLSDPAIAAVLETFPGAEIAVTKRSVIPHVE